MWILFFLSFCIGEVDHLSLCYKASLVVFSHFCWPFLSTFRPLLPSLYLSSHNPLIVDVVSLIFCNLLVSLSQIFSVISHLSFNYFANYASLSFLNHIYRFKFSPYFQQFVHCQTCFILSCLYTILVFCYRIIKNSKPSPFQLCAICA